MKSISEMTSYTAVTPTFSGQEKLLVCLGRQGGEKWSEVIVAEGAAIQAALLVSFVLSRVRIG